MGQLHLIPDPERLEESCALAAAYDACFEYNDFYDLSLLDDDARRRERIESYLRLERDRSRDTLHGAFLDVTVHSEDPLIRAASERRVMQSMEAAGALGVRGVVFHTGTIPNFKSGYYTENWLRRNRAFWRRVAERYPDTEILMENMFDLDPTLLLALADELRDVPTFGVCLDYAHAMAFGSAWGTPERWLDVLAPHVRHLHINDNDGVDDLHDAVGQGVIDWEGFTRAVRTLERAPSVLVEVKPLEKQALSLRQMKCHHIYPFDAERS